MFTVAVGPKLVELYVPVPCIESFAVGLVPIPTLPVDGY
jgi:hypothetical protein